MERQRQSLARPQRRVCRRTGQDVQSVKPVCPATNDDEVTEPGPERFDQPRERSGVFHLTLPH